MLKVGMTGGIGSGKSTVAKCFRELGVTIIDSDEIAHQLTARGQPMYQAIIDKYGDSILNPAGEINRQALRQLIFDQPQEKYWLESLLHPLIFKKIEEAAQTARPPYCMIVIPLLVETDANHLVDRVLVIDTPIEKQIERSRQRDQSSEETIRKIIASQASREHRLAIADDVINNDGNFANLKSQVNLLHARYLKLATGT